jgi:hypothetical protein
MPYNSCSWGGEEEEEGHSKQIEGEKVTIHLRQKTFIFKTFLIYNFHILSILCCYLKIKNHLVLKFAIASLICMPDAEDKTREIFFVKNSPQNLCKVQPKYFEDILTDRLQTFAAKIS